MGARRPLLFAEENQRLLKQVEESTQASSLLLSLVLMSSSMKLMLEDTRSHTVSRFEKIVSETAKMEENWLFI